MSDVNDARPDGDAVDEYIPADEPTYTEAAMTAVTEAIRGSSLVATLGLALVGCQFLVDPPQWMPLRGLEIDLALIVRCAVGYGVLAGAVSVWAHVVEVRAWREAHRLDGDLR